MTPDVQDKGIGAGPKIHGGNEQESDSSDGGDQDAGDAMQLGEVMCTRRVWVNDGTDGYDGTLQVELGPVPENNGLSTLCGLWGLEPRHRQSGSDADACVMRGVCLGSDQCQMEGKRCKLTDESSER